ncbi:MAG: DHH family phosphoesterase [Anaerostipes sp.]|uniref:DHH family phosphoesterase n=1 Tax=Anaerostipes sp. TaxID=1872530 RepID=UPI003996A60F
MKNFSQKIQNAANIAVTGHIHPDGDCIGSCLALKQYILDNYPEKSVDVYLEPISPDFAFLSHSNEILSQPKELTYDLFFVLDCGSEDRFAPFAEMVKQADYVICFDHHISNQGFGDEFVIDAKASATSEVLCRIFEEEKISKECAQCLFTGIVHDTGVFKHSNTTRASMSYAGMLIERGASNTRIIDETFYQKTFAQNKLLGRALQNSHLAANGNIIFSVLTEEDFHKCDAQRSDTDGIIDQLRVTKGVETAVFLYALPEGQWKVSMRSNEIVNVAEIAQSFGGGGHIRAAGCSLFGSTDKILAEIISKIEKQL